MKRVKQILFAALLVTALFIAAAPPVKAQLITNNQKMKIVKVEREFNRLQCRVHEGENDSVQYILIDGDTKFSTKDRIVSFDEAWKLFKPDMIIRVKGGITVTGKTKAKTILW